MACQMGHCWPLRAVSGQVWHIKSGSVGQTSHSDLLGHISLSSASCIHLLPIILVILDVADDLVVRLLLLEAVALNDVLNEVGLVNGVAKALLTTHYALIVQQAAGGQRS